MNIRDYFTKDSLKYTAKLMLPVFLLWAGAVAYVKHEEKKLENYLKSLPSLEYTVSSGDRIWYFYNTEKDFPGMPRGKEPWTVYQWLFQKLNPDKNLEAALQPGEKLVLPDFDRDGNVGR